MVNPQDFIDALQIADPINVPDFVPRPALLMNGLSDIIMVLDNALRFRESMCLAEQIWTTGGHYFPMYAAEYLLIDYIAGQYAASPAFSRGVRMDVGPGFSFTEQVRAPVAGADNLWVDVRAELGTPDIVTRHQLSVPMVNRAVPVVVMSRETMRLAPFLLGRHLPAFIKSSTAMLRSSYPLRWHAPSSGATPIRSLLCSSHVDGRRRAGRLLLGSAFAMNRLCSCVLESFRAF